MCGGWVQRAQGKNSRASKILPRRRRNRLLLGDFGSTGLLDFFAWLALAGQGVNLGASVAPGLDAFARVCSAAKAAATEAYRSSV